MPTRRIPFFCVATLAAMSACTGGTYATVTTSEPTELPECTDYLSVYGPCLEQGGSATHAQAARRVADLRAAYARVASDPTRVSDLRATCDSKLAEVVKACPAAAPNAAP